LREACGDYYEKGGGSMATYIMLFRFTRRGIENIKESPSRVEAAKKVLRDMGGEVKAFYMVLGRYDTVLIVEVPDDETVAKIALHLGRLGNVRTETLRAFTENEYGKIVASLS
jgi:uncharacterized protein with GYD domain